MAMYAIKNFSIIVCLMAFNQAISQVKPANYLDANGLRQGFWEHYMVLKNGTKYLHFLGYYKDGHKNGRCIDFRENGKLYTEGYYTKDTIDGERKVYRENGSLYQIENYKMGKLHGWRKFFNLEGKIVDEQEWKDGKENGVYRLYHESGRLDAESYHINGIENGTRKIYEDKPSNHCIREFDFVNGKMVKSRYYENGVLVRESAPDN